MSPQRVDPGVLGSSLLISKRMGWYPPNTISWEDSVACILLCVTISSMNLEAVYCGDAADLRSFSLTFDWLFLPKARPVRSCSCARGWPRAYIRSGTISLAAHTGPQIPSLTFSCFTLLFWFTQQCLRLENAGCRHHLLAYRTCGYVFGTSLAFLLTLISKCLSFS